MNVLREIYDFVTGGSIAAPIALACAIIAAALLRAYRGEALVGILFLGFVASTLEKPN